jgi:cysteine desulfurase/selenocysteine lyase
MEFFEVALPWKQLAVTKGIFLDIAPHRDGRVGIQDIAAALRPRTRAVIISAVQWNNGFRCDLAELSELCRERGVWPVVDAIQQLGAVPIRVHQTPVDFLARGGHKWLNSPFGAGLLYIRRESMPRMRPPRSGYLALADPPGGWGNYFQTPAISPLDEHSIATGARRYETGGTSNYPGAIALGASLSLLNEAGPTMSPLKS